MRPNTTTDDADVYECMACGSRFESPETKECDDCGGELRSLGTSRDL